MSKVPTNVNVCKNTIQQESFKNVHKCQFCQKQPKKHIIDHVQIFEEHTNRDFSMYDLDKRQQECV